MITVGIEQERFNARLNRFIEQSDLSAAVIIRKTAFDLLRNIIKPEPYGTLK